MSICQKCDFFSDLFGGGCYNCKGRMCQTCVERFFISNNIPIPSRIIVSDVKLCIDCDKTYEACTCGLIREKSKTGENCDSCGYYFCNHCRVKKGKTCKYCIEEKAKNEFYLE